MQLHLSVRSPGIALDTILAPEALPKLMELIQEHRVNEPTPGLGRLRRGRRMRHFPIDGEAAKLDSHSLSVREQVTSVDDLKAFYLKAQPQTFPEKFLVVAAWHDASVDLKSEDRVFKGRHLVRALVRLGETPPANPPRDVHQAIDQGWFLQIEPGTGLLSITNVGWKRLGEMLEGDEPVVV